MFWEQRGPRLLKCSQAGQRPPSSSKVQRLLVRGPEGTTRSAPTGGGCRSALHLVEASEWAARTRVLRLGGQCQEGIASSSVLSPKPVTPRPAGDLPRSP